ncbi:MAG: hypothetical protein RL411_683, partial [Bacteroidota bacterium]
VGCGDEHHEFWGFCGYRGEAGWVGAHFAVGTQVCEESGRGGGVIAACEGEGAGSGSGQKTDTVNDEVLRFGKHLLTNFVPFLV